VQGGHHGVPAQVAANAARVGSPIGPLFLRVIGAAIRPSAQKDINRRFNRRGRRLAVTSTTVGKGPIIGAARSALLLIIKGRRARRGPAPATIGELGPDHHLRIANVAQHVEVGRHALCHRRENGIGKLIIRTPHEPRWAASAQGANILKVKPSIVLTVPFVSRLSASQLWCRARYCRSARHWRGLHEGERNGSWICGLAMDAAHLGSWQYDPFYGPCVAIGLALHESPMMLRSTGRSAWRQHRQSGARRLAM
jgi:hypothetical protein